MEAGPLSLQFYILKKIKTMQTIKEKINHLNQLILEGKALEGFDLYYDDEVVMQENESPATIGKEANRQREIDFFGSITEFRGAKPLDIAIGENISYVKWHYDYTHKDWGVRKYTQVSVQHWKDGKIVKEQFFYGN
jgi:SnoaL-like domain